MSDYVVSILVPTRDRLCYLKECIETLIEINSEQLEIVIQDNSSCNSATMEFMNSIDSHHVKYFYDPDPCSQTGNFNRAIENSSGEYVVIIGDDDSVTSFVVDLTKLMRKFNVDACNVNMAGYYWPDVFSSKVDKVPLSFDSRPVKVKRIDTRKALSKYLKTGMQDLKYLPRVYHAILSRRILNEIKTKAGNYCPGPSPDMANAVAASCYMNWHLVVEFPVIVSGSSFNSAAGKGLRGEHKGDLSTVKQLPSDVEAGWNPIIPKVWLGNTIWPESAMRALEATGNTGLKDEFNRFPMYARVFLKHREYRDLIFDYLVKPSDYIRLAYWCVIELSNWLFRKIKHTAKKISKNEFVLEEVISLQEACKITEKHIIDNRIISDIEKEFDNALR